MLRLSDVKDYDTQLPSRIFEDESFSLEVTQTHFWMLVAPCPFAEFKNDRKALRRRMRLVATILPDENGFSGKLLPCEQLLQCRALQRELPNT